ncbi:rhodanese domain-containing protein CG4456-like isoform X2 [Ischnura elegans]|uniref:rhodanese domain-containing protein CG4456-like isoform X2 n=1 Tax=Ischnura elegans TaxID=197161 RepID=UPI001ED8AC5C|nr:rhodanese domain-containing protein CG4456-like isoform X2 [Ischnura elegans]
MLSSTKLLNLFRCSYSFSRLHSLLRNASYSPIVCSNLHRKRWLSPTAALFSVSSAMESKDLDYEQLIDARKNRNILLVDVRNPDELEAGSIPNSINVPLGELDTALKMDDASFENRYKHKKPQKEAEIIFSCRSGNRSRRALELALSLGFMNAKHYTGGWLDWAEKTKN